MNAVRASGRSAIVVGAGIQGLLAALVLRDRGYAVRVHSAGADPRTNGDTRSSTSGGESARLITLLEGCPYVGHAADSPEIAGVFERPVSQGGWLGERIDSTAQNSTAQNDPLHAAARAADSSRTPVSVSAPLDPRLAPRREGASLEVRNDNVNVWLRSRQAAWLDRNRVDHTLNAYVATARRSMDLWRTLHADRPALFAGCGWHDAGVLRMFDDARTLAAAAAVHHDLGVLDEALSPTDLARAFPLYAKAVDTGVVAGGLRVRGYALDVRRFVRNAIATLEADGVRFAWQSECHGPTLDDHGRVTGLRFAGSVERADDYVLTPGAYGGALLRSLGVQAGGLAGRWLLLPKPVGFDLPTKIHFGPRQTADGRRPVLDLNLMAYFDAARQRETVAVGGGYLHVGEYPFRYDPAEMRIVDEEIERAVRRLMPLAGPVERSAAMCVRSLTADDRPIELIRDTDRGGRLVLHTGFNTGTTAMGPAVAEELVVRLNPIS